MGVRLTAAGSAGGAGEGAQSLQDVLFTWGVKIPMRDGVSLHATVYRPEGNESVPALFTLTPYIADSYHPRYFLCPAGIRLH